MDNFRVREGKSGMKNYPPNAGRGPDVRPFPVLLFFHLKLEMEKGCNFLAPQYVY